jgi:hypothetical protein
MPSKERRHVPKAMLYVREIRVLKGAFYAAVTLFCGDVVVRW